MRSRRPFAIDRFVIRMVLIALAMGPLLIVLSPVLALLVVRQREAARAEGLRALWPFMVRTLERYAAAMIAVEDPVVPWREVALGVDRFLSSHVSARGWRMSLLLVGLEIAPVFDGRPPASWSSREGLRRFCDRRLATSWGVYGRLGLVRQLLRLSYYRAPAAHVAMGFVPVAERARLRGTTRVDAVPSSGALVGVAS